MIRRLLSRGQSVKYLIDDMVLEYIKQFGLYESKTYVLIDLFYEFITLVSNTISF